MTGRGPNGHSIAMGTNDPLIAELVPDDETVDRPALVERAVAQGLLETTHRATSRSASARRNYILLKALTDGARVRIRVNGEISNDRFAGAPETRRDSDVAISCIDEKGELDSFRFTGDILEFEILDGDVTVVLNDEEVDPVTLDLPNEIGLEALTDEAKVKIQVSGKISADRFAGDVEVICDGHVVIGRIHEEDGPNRFRFSGDVVEFKVMRGDVRVKFTVAGRDS